MAKERVKVWKTPLNLVKNFIPRLFQEAGVSDAGKPPAGYDKPASRDSSRDVLSRLGDYVYNPDALIEKKGLAVFDNMLDENAEIKAAYNLKRFARLSTGWELYPAEEKNDKATEMWDFVNWNFNNMNTSVDSFLLKIWDAMRCGYKVAELIWYMIDYGPWKGKIGLKDIWVRNSKDFGFEADEYGQLKPKGLIQDPGGDNIKLDQDKFVIYTWGGMDDDAVSKYGKSDFRCIFRYHWSNDLIMRLWNLALEKYAKPTPIGYFPDGVGDDVKTALKNALEEIYIRASTIFPDSMKVEVLEPKQGKGVDYREAMEFNNAMIRKGLLVGEKLLEAGERGSYALSKTMFSVFVLILEHLGRETENDIMGRQIIRRLVDMNWETNLYPRFVMPSLVSDDKEAMARLVEMCIANGIVKSSETWIRDYLDLPARDSEDVLPDNDNIKDWWKVLPEEVRDRLVKDKKVLVPISTDDIGTREDASGLPDTGGDGAMTTDKREADKFAEIERKESGIISNPEDLADTDSIEKDLNLLETESVRRIQGEYTEIFEDLLKRFARGKLKFDPADLARVVPNVGELRQAIEELLNEAWVRGQLSGENDYTIRELDKKKEEIKATAKASSDEQEVETFVELEELGKILGITAITKKLKKALKRIPWRQKELDDIAKKHANEAFIAAGTDGNAVKEVFQRVMMQASAEGWGVDDFKKAIKREAGKFYKTAEGKAAGLEAARAANVYRTLMNDAYNKGRKDYFGKRGEVIGYVYSAVLDTRTTPICRELHGREFEKDSPLLDSYTPPNHWGAVVKGTKILTERGYVNIEDLTREDRVFTRASVFRRVSIISQRKHTGDLIRVLVVPYSDGLKEREIILTDDHPVFTQRFWVQAKNLSISDQVCTIFDDVKEGAKFLNCSYAPIKMIDRIFYDDYVFDLTVPIDESYTANGIVVHNCRSILAPVLRGEELIPTESGDIKIAPSPDWQGIGEGLEDKTTLDKATRDLYESEQKRIARARGETWRPKERQTKSERKVRIVPTPK